jgi:hypothetical protein
MNRRLRIVAIAAGMAACGSLAAAQTGAQDPSRKFAITDNSFLVEESFNQERGVVQNIFMWTRAKDGNWQAAFTQEWPLGGMTHQFSYTVPFSRFGTNTGVNDVLLNYRYQLWMETADRPAISPRLSLVLPTGSESNGLGGGGTGIQINVPASKQFGNLYLHGNAGGTWIHNADWTTQLAASGIFRVRDMVHLMLEGVALVGDSFTVSPGIRGGWNVGDAQIVVGAAVPITRASGDSTAALLTYFSYEFPFSK